jgi:hypothetical protein
MMGRLVLAVLGLATSDFRSFDPNVTYPQSGSFMQSILDTCGLAGVKRPYDTGSEADSAASVRTRFEAACGRRVDDVEADWRDMLARGDAGRNSR